MLSPGDKPDLNFPVHINLDGKKTSVPFSSLVKGPAVVSVYMRNNTSVCDLQVAELVAKTDGILRTGWNILAVSRDTCASHSKYAEKIGSRFTLVSDPEDAFAKAVDSMVEKSMYGKKYMGPTRAAYLIDGSGEILGVIPKVDAGNHGDQILAAIATIGKK